MKKTVLKKYAALIVRCGLHVEKKQEVLIHAELDQPEFVKMVVEECYRAGASKVTVQWDYQPLEKIHIRGRSLKTLRQVEAWEEARMRPLCGNAALPPSPDLRRPGWFDRREYGKAGQGAAGPLPGDEALPGCDGGEVSVVHRRSTRRGLGKKSLPVPSEIPGSRTAVGRHPASFPGRR